MAGWGSCLGVDVLLAWCEEVGVSEIGRWWKAGQCVNGIEGKACVVLCSLQIAVVDGMIRWMGCGRVSVSG